MALNGHRYRLAELAFSAGAQPLRRARRARRGERARGTRVRDLARNASAERGPRAGAS